jgi:pyruvate/2-oxoglutarate dehydrogenase complex dihydrolipoamide dehydrogenase (E3) component
LEENYRLEKILMSKDKYDFIIIGAGSAGLSAAEFASKLGIKVLLVEANKIGGDCTWTGCVPSKALLHCANQFHEAQEGIAQKYISGEIQVNFSEIMEYVRSKINIIAESESPDVLREEGIDVLIGEAQFSSSTQIKVNYETYTGKRILISTGAKPSIPPINGINQIPYLTYETIFNLEELPTHLLVIGGGPIGCEMAQAFRRFGSEVTIVEGMSHLLPRDDPEVCKVIEEQFQEEGIKIISKDLVIRVKTDDSTNEINVQTRNGIELRGSHLLVAVGRKSMNSKLNLQYANVQLDERGGIVVDNNLRTSNGNIYAAGDCLGGLQFTHLAGFQGFVAARNALLPGSTTGLPKNIPWTTFTQPEVAHVGLRQKREFIKPEEVMTCFWPLNKSDRAIIDSKTRGFVKVLNKKSGEILGVSIVAPNAGEMIHEWILAIDKGIKIDSVASSIHVYPTYSISHQQLAGAIKINQYLKSTTGKIVNEVSRFFR